MELKVHEEKQGEYKVKSVDIRLTRRKGLRSSDRLSEKVQTKKVGKRDKNPCSRQLYEE
jgi:hypothetical protein